MEKEKRGFGPIVILIILVVIMAVGFFAYKAGVNSDSATNSTDDTIVENIPADTVVDGSCKTPSITVLSPNGGETYTVGQKITITWTSCGFSPSDSVSVNLQDDSIHCQANIVGCWSSFGAGVTTNTGSFTWDTSLNMFGDGGPNSVPVKPGSMYRIALSIYSSSTPGLSTSDASNNTLVINTPTNQNTINEPNWGVTFIKAPSWNITTNTNDKIVLTQGAAGSEGDTITLTYSTGISVSDSDAKFGNVIYFFDTPTGQWMKTQGSESGIGGPETTPAISVMTVDGMPVFRGTGRWLTYIVARSQTQFVKLNVSGGGYTQPLTDLVKTIKKI